LICKGQVSLELACPPKSGPALMGIVELAGSARERPMRKRPRPDQIVSTLGQIQVDLQAGLNIHQACRKAGIGLTTYYRWKARQENPLSDEQLSISELEDEVGRLKHLVAELALDRRMLQEALKKKP
jgi:putative transposase